MLCKICNKKNQVRPSNTFCEECDRIRKLLFNNDEEKLGDLIHNHVDLYITYSDSTFSSEEKTIIEETERMPLLKLFKNKDISFCGEIDLLNFDLEYYRRISYGQDYSEIIKAIVKHKRDRIDLGD